MAEEKAENMEKLSIEESETLQALAGPAHKKNLGAGESEKIDADDVLEDSEPINEEDKIVIGDKEFSSQEEALAYARELQQKGDTDKLLYDAYRQGIEDARIGGQNTEVVTQQEEDDDPDFEQKFFENPKAFMKEYAEKVRKEAMDETLRQIRQEQQDQQLWSEFYSRNPDLEGFQQDCELVLSQESNMIKTLVQTQGKEKAMDYLGRKVRAKFQTWAERQRPRQDLERSNAQASPTAGQRVTQSSQEKNEGPVDFVAQMRQHKRALENPS